MTEPFTSADELWKRIWSNASPHTVLSWWSRQSMGQYLYLSTGDDDAYQAALDYAWTSE